MHSFHVVVCFMLASIIIMSCSLASMGFTVNCSLVSMALSVSCSLVSMAYSVSCSLVSMALSVSCSLVSMAFSVSCSPCCLHCIKALSTQNRSFMSSLHMSFPKYNSDMCILYRYYTYIRTYVIRHCLSIDTRNLWFKYVQY
jgi:hypothetical protein